MIQVIYESEWELSPWYVRLFYKYRRVIFYGDTTQNVIIRTKYEYSNQTS